MEMFKFSVFAFIFFITHCLCQDLSSKAKLQNPNGYLANIVQETFYELEEFGFCNLKLNDFTQDINIPIYGWNVTGQVTYSNGFLVSIEKVDLSRVTNFFMHATVNGTLVSTAVFQGRINLRDAKIGYDVTANLTKEGVSRYTGVFTHTLLEMSITISKNMQTGKTSVSVSVGSVSAGSGVRMIYLPANNITEVISRQFRPASTFDSVDLWCREVIGPIMEKVVARTEFPDFCFSC